LKPASAVVGTSGKPAERVADVTASALPERVCGSSTGTSGTFIPMWPPSPRRCAAVGHVNEIDITSVLSSSTGRCVEVPVPAEPKLIFCGLFFA
jgi:hypothetical protein